MNFLKISGLLIGTGSVVGGAGAGVYYGVIKNNETEFTKDDSVTENNRKVNFVGKLAFFKKSGESTNTLYEMKLLNNSDYDDAVRKFNEIAIDGSKHENVNKFIEISNSLNFENTKSKLDSIFGNEINLVNAKKKITEKETELKELFGESIYAKLQNIN